MFRFCALDPIRADIYSALNILEPQVDVLRVLMTYAYVHCENDMVVLALSRAANLPVARLLLTSYCVPALPPVGSSARVVLC